MILFNYGNDLPNTKRNGLIIMTTTFDGLNLETVSYLTYKRAYDMKYGTDYTKQHYEMTTHTTHTQTTVKTEQITLNNGVRNVIGNYNDNDVIIEKMFTHLNSMKRAIVLNGLTDDVNAKMQHENLMLRELLNLEFTLRTFKKNNK
jgi:hypothetical protein